MTITWLPANQAYVVMFGNEIIDIDGKRLFSSEQSLLYALKTKGLTVDGNKIIVIGGGI